MPTASGAEVDRQWTPPKPTEPPLVARKPNGRRRALVLIGGAVAVVLLAGGAAALGIWATTDTHVTAAPPSPPTTLEEPALEATTPAPTTPAPSSEEPEAEPGAEASSPSDPAALYESSPSGTSLVNDLSAFEDDGYQAGAQKVNLREYPLALRNGDTDCRTEATWQLDRTYKSLVAGIGLSDDSGTGSSADFTIFVDDRTRFQRTIKVGESAQTATVDLSGAFRVTLTVENCNGPGIAAWLDPVITK